MALKQFFTGFFKGILTFHRFIKAKTPSSVLGGGGGGGGGGGRGRGGHVPPTQMPFRNNMIEEHMELILVKIY